MRIFLTTVVVGILLGFGVGYGIGEIQSRQMAWNPSLEINKGVELSKVGKEAPEPAAEPSSEKSAAAKAQRKQPRVKIDETEFDFGIVEKNPSNERGEHPFYIENVGTADMTLADGGKGCFCTEFTISKSTIKPGEKATVLFKWDGARSGGVFNQGIRVLTNDPDRKEVVFAVRGLYTSPIVCDVGEITFHNVTPNQESSRAFRIMGFEKNEDGTPYPLEISGIEIPDTEHFEVTINKDSIDNLTDADRQSKLYSQTQNLFQGLVVLKPGMRQGSFKEEIRVKTNSPKTPYFDLHVVGQVSGSSVKITGALFDDKESGQLRLNEVSAATGKKTSVRLTITDPLICNEKTVRVKSVRPDWIDVKLTYPPEELQKSSPIRLVTAEIEVPAGSPQGNFMGPKKEELGEIVFSMGEKEESSQEIVIPVRFAVTP